ncbi:MAG: hypothetical protein IJ163_00640 [Bacteroidaceae bacterium]|nr:hypothetical protein [Bacteroidaceae bacterium]
MIRHLLLLLLSCFLSVGLKAQDVPNTLVIHLAGGVDEVRVPVDEVDSLFLEVEEETIYLRQTDGSLHGYPLVGVSYMDFTHEERSPYQSVDLGLSVEWATFNVGASQPEDYGDLFSWGETTPKADYSESAYLYYHNYEYDYIGVNICGTKYDAATACWGGEWRMPVLSEVRELTDRCNWTADTLNGVSGYKVTGPNGNSIFLPRAGYQTSTERQSAGHDGYYWCGSLNRSKPSSAYNLNFSGYAAEWSANRSMGFSIRAVRPKKN